MLFPKPAVSCVCVQECTPFAVIGSNTVVEARGQRVRGRLYPWGIVEGTFRHHVFIHLTNLIASKDTDCSCILNIFSCPVENQSHCDFVKLRNMLIRSHMHDLKDVTCDVHYENYRAQCIQEMTRYECVFVEKKCISDAADSPASPRPLFPQ